jgi:hypothetical protein
MKNQINYYAFLRAVVLRYLYGYVMIISYMYKILQHVFCVYFQIG